MRPRLLILILLIVGVPCGLLVWAAVRIARDEQIVVQQQFHDLMEQRLHDVNDTVERHFQQVEARVLQITTLDHPQVDQLREITRTSPEIMQMFVLAPGGQLEYPSPADPLNSDERSFLLRAARIFTDRHLTATEIDAVASNTLTSDLALVLDRQSKSFDLPQQSEAQMANVPAISGDEARFEQTGVEVESQAAAPRTGWFVWYWDGGLNLIYWNRRPSGQIVGTALDRSRWMSDLIGQLPDTASSDDSSRGSGIESRIRLVNAASDPVYQWGSGTESTRELVSEVALAAPLSSWRLQCLIPPDQMPGQSQGTFWGFTGGVTAVGIAMALLAFVLVRDYSRDMREARSPMNSKRR